MTDTKTEQKVKVWATDTEWPYISVPDTQLPRLQSLLDAAGIGYEVEENVISFGGGPEMATVNLRRGTDGNKVQKLLDSAH